MEKFAQNSLKQLGKEQEKPICLKAMPKLTHAHLFPNNFEKMRVSLAFQLFSDEVLKGLHLYEVISEYGNPKTTINFSFNIKTLIEIMTARFAREGISKGRKQHDALKDFLKFLCVWELYCTKNNFSSIRKSTNDGFKVTISSTLSLLEYLTDTVGFKYLMTSRLSQDKIENLFSIVHQTKGCNDHPTPSEFLTIIECLSFYNLARSSKGGNALISPSAYHLSDVESSAAENILLQSAIANIVKNQNIGNSTKRKCPDNLDHNDVVRSSDLRLIYYTAGYVVRIFLKKIPCGVCNQLLVYSDEEVNIEIVNFMKTLDRGGLLYLSNSLFHLIINMENKFTEFLSLNELHKETTFDVISALNTVNLEPVGCSHHKIALTEQIIKFFILTRMHFHLKIISKSNDGKRQRLKHLKMRRCN